MSVVLAPLLLQLALALMTPQQKAAMVVVSGLPAPPGVGGVFVSESTRTLPRPPGALVFTDQEGGQVKNFPQLPPWRAPADFEHTGGAFLSGRATGAALERVGVDVDFAPVLDMPTGPLGSRQFRRPELGVAFARGLGRHACVKHFPGLGSTAVSTDDRVHVEGRLSSADLAPFRAAIAAGARCVMVNNAFYPRFGPYRASTSPGAYRLLRSLGFDGVAITDTLALPVLRGHPAPVEWARRAVLAGADLVLYTNPSDAARAVAALVPLAQRGLLDEHVTRVLRLRALES